MSGKSTPQSTPPRMTPTRNSPPRGTTPTRLNASKAALVASRAMSASVSVTSGGHNHAHSLSMLGAERYQNQLCSTANAELFNGKKKNPSMYRRPSELGLSTQRMEDKSEVKSNYIPVAGGRQHIVKPIPDHKETYQAAVEEWEEEESKETESSSHYKNLAPRRPVCQKLNDHLTLGIEGEVEKDSEVRATYKDLHAKRPICQKLIDHTEEIQPREEMEETSEYRDTLNKIEDMKLEGVVLKGERAIPPWLNMQKVTPFGTNQDVTRE